MPVPVDWSRPKGEKLGVVIGRSKAAEPEHRIGVLFVAPGGPGCPGSRAHTGPNRLNAGELRKRFDIVTWSQRGVGRSNEVKCSAKLLAQWPANYPSSEQEYQDLLAFNAKLGADCRRHTCLVSGVGHGQYMRSTCAQVHIERYLTDLVTPEPNTHCPAVYPTVPPPAALATSDAPATPDAASRPVHLAG